MRKAITRREAIKISKRTGYDINPGDGRTFYATTDDEQGVWEFDSKKERDEWVRMDNEKNMTQDVIIVRVYASKDIDGFHAYKAGDQIQVHHGVRVEADPETIRIYHANGLHTCYKADGVRIEMEVEG